jgi:N-acetylneuraminic acid mutarotase
MKKVFPVILFSCIILSLNGQDWAWMKGPKTVNNFGNYGTISVPAPNTRPGSRHGGATWTDLSGNLWFFGGEGYGTSGPLAWLSDLWKYNISTNQWTWINGPSATNQSGSYGTKGVGSTTNCPGAREFISYWTDASGKFWLFGGDGFDAFGNFGNLNDLWRYDPLTNEWTWMHGTNMAGQHGIYGSLTVPSATAMPGGRWGATYWSDNSNNLWLFSGYGFAAAGTNGELNDLWKYNITTNQWTWMKGAPAINQSGTYGTLNVASAANVPGAREHSSAALSSGNAIYIFGGRGFPETGPIGMLSDTWKYDPLNNEFTWMHGPKTTATNGNYGTQNVSSPTNIPGSRYTQVFWRDNSGDFWIFGGLGFAAIGGVGRLADLWKFSPSTNEWTWVEGPDTLDWQGIYGTQAVPNPTNNPGGRNYSNGWKDNSGNLWLFGGFGFPEIGGTGNMNDLWRYDLGCAVIDSTTNANISICSGNSTTLSAYSTQGSVNWHSSPTSTTVLASGNTYITLTYTTGTSFTTQTFYVEAPTCTLVPGRTPITVTVYPLPILTVSTSNTLICAGNSSTLNVNGALTYTWSTSSTGSSITVSPGVTTIYTVSGTDINGCESSDTITQYVSACVGIKESSSETHFTVYPNPTKGMITIVSDSEGYLEIFTITGQKILSQEVAKHKTQINLSNWPAGIYVYRLKGKDSLKNGRIILQD